MKVREIQMFIADAVSEKLGRASHVHRVKNSTECYINDPVLSHIQKAMKRDKNSRYGFNVTKDGEIYFSLEHAFCIGELFGKNLNAGDLLSAARQTAQYRTSNCIAWSSRLYGATNKKPVLHIQEDRIRDFANKLAPWVLNNRLPKDFTCGIDANEIKNDGPKRIPRHFSLLLAEPRELKNFTFADARKIVDAAWPLFAAMYPKEALKGRSANLARSLHADGIAKRNCEYLKIKKIGVKARQISCKGPLHGAHIKPDCLGGSDQADNGLWLCSKHHKLTEGKIKGRRIGAKVMVHLTDAIDMPGERLG